MRSIPTVCLVLISTFGIAEEPTSLVPKDYPPGNLGKVVRLGEEIVFETKEHPLSKKYVGNALNCTSCHLDGGQHPQAASFIGIATAYPAWSPREERAITLEDRVLNCFMRSQNGVRPPLGSEVSVAITTYITWLSTGQSIAQNPNKPLGPRHVPSLDIKNFKPDPVRGKELYVERCADCHGNTGEGLESGPPVWGADSFNDGAGLSHNDKLASWLKVAMPLDDETLTTQEAFDIAAFVNQHERPKFNLQEHLPDADKLGEYNGKQD
ncbi:c-type cytochrome [Polystyrenella longa]|uniref:c-type cytochrome n=1 Tax=Polystyrenella longa TaxID=2528007 RepID=UPI001E60F343|nr:c-type cytochrome [Polystyrenella longa]